MNKKNTAIDLIFQIVLKHAIVENCLELEISNLIREVHVQFQCV